MTKRIVPITFSWHVPTESADYICAILNSFINGLQDSGVDIYERAKFTIENTSDIKLDRIRGKYGFDGTTGNQRGQLIEIASAYVEVEDETN